MLRRCQGRTVRALVIAVASGCGLAGTLLTVTSTGLRSGEDGGSGKPAARHTFVYGLGSEPSPAVRRAGARAVGAFYAGRAVAEGAGCAACHRFGARGKHGPGAALTRVGSRLNDVDIERVLSHAPAPMPPVRHLARRKREALVQFLADLRG